MTPNRITIALALLLSLLFSTPTSQAFSISSIEDSEIEANGNPHQRKITNEEGEANKEPCTNDSIDTTTTAICEPRSILRPHLILRQVIPTQPDTFLGIVRRKILSVPVPVYQFKQPSRVSHLELPFEIVLLSDLDEADKATLRDVPVDPKMALDSWFPGYAWTPVVCNGGCREEGSGYIHIGWRFTSTSDTEDYFYALIVNTTRKGKEKVAAGVLEKGILTGVEIGTLAPGWMISALSSIA